MKLYRNLSTAVVASLREIFSEARYADRVIEKVLKQDARWGARDRRFIAETTYDIVRWVRLYREWYQIGAGDFWSLLGAWCLQQDITLPDWPEFDRIRNVRPGPPPSVRAVVESIPDWLDQLGMQELGQQWPTELHALNEQARVVLRVNTLRTTTKELQHELLSEHDIETESLARFPDALILRQRQNIFSLPAFKNGLFEMQDAGSQEIAPFLDATPGMRVVDACAGAGGKSLHLAALLKNKGRILSMDTEGWKLDNLKQRARRAGASNIETRVIESSKTIKRLGDSADRVLLDVPCSGLGVLRRNPDAKWKLDAAFIDRVRETQQKILTDYATMVKTGGKLVYSTCSLLPSENENQVADFLKAHTNFTLETEKSILPSEGFDGFYMARLVRTA